MKKYTIITGANRGIGKELSMQLAKLGYSLIITARDSKKGKIALQEVHNHSPKVSVLFHELDVSDEKSINKFGKYLAKENLVVETLVNNAGLMAGTQTTETVKLQDVQRSLDTNFIGPLLMSQQVIPILKEHGGGKIINVSSGMGSFHEMYGGYAAYRISKTALNSLTAVMARDVAHLGIKVFSVCPGWVKTDMGGASAPRDIQAGVDSIKWLITKNNAVSGKFYRDKEQIEF